MPTSLAINSGLANKDRSFHEAPEKTGGEGWLYSQQPQKLCHFKPDMATVDGAGFLRLTPSSNNGKDQCIALDCTTPHQR